MNKEDVQFLDDNGEVIVGDIKEYMRKKRESMLTITDKLNVGDVVKLKGSGQIVVVQFVDYKFNEIVKADYAGAQIPDAFVVGYGLDYDEKYRNLPFVGALKPAVYE